MVLLKGHGPDGFRFFTNYESAKAGQLEAEPARGAGRLLARARPPGAGPRARSSGCRRGRLRRLLREPPAGQPARRLGLAAEPAAGRPRGARASCSRRPTSACEGVEEVPRPPPLGRLPAAPGDDRVLAGPAAPASTTASSTGATRAAGRSSASPPERSTADGPISRSHGAVFVPSAVCLIRRRRRRAPAARSARGWRPRASPAAETWALTVATERWSSVEISALERPRPTASATSRSRGLSRSISSSRRARRGRAVAARRRPARSAAG